jgi:hypothetical protein
MSRDERLILVDWDDPELPIADFLSLNRSSLYYKPIPLRASLCFFKILRTPIILLGFFGNFQAKYV